MDIKPPAQADSINIQLIDGNIIATGGALQLFLNLYLEVSNNKKCNILIKNNSTLELRIDSTVLKFELSSDSIDYQLENNEKKQLHLCFEVRDFENVAYKTIDTPNQHKLYLFLNLQDDFGRKIKKCVVLNPKGTKRMRYEKASRP